ncbi:MAG: hypothetical protein IT379_29510 [Deltaproteobacteria bacterium]|nr:hypothetical protein [Deltaproteobacteria bacterium]
MISRTVLAAAAVLLAACPDESAGSSSGSPGATFPTEANAFFPASLGDRWRYRAQGGSPRLAAVTSTSEGVIVMHGVGTPTVRYKANAREVAVVDLAGRTMYPLLRGPLRRGEEWRYELTERDVRIPCKVRVGRDRADWTFRGTKVAGCVELARECRYPRGVPFDRETRHTEREIWCPAIGRVSTEASFDPPPPRGFLPAFSRERLAAFRVRGAPVVSSLPVFSCDDLILVSSDVAAACGTSLDPVEPEAGLSHEGTCTYVWEVPGAARIRVRVSRLARDATTEDLDRALGAIASGATTQSETGIERARRISSDPGIFAFSEGAHVASIEAGSRACSPDGARKLIPLVRSLLR